MDKPKPGTMLEMFDRLQKLETERASTLRALEIVKTAVCGSIDGSVPGIFEKIRDLQATYDRQSKEVAALKIWMESMAKELRALQEYKTEHSTITRESMAAAIQHAISMKENKVFERLQDLERWRSMTVGGLVILNLILVVILKFAK